MLRRKLTFGVYMSRLLADTFFKGQHEGRKVRAGLRNQVYLLFRRALAGI
jgi:hypothetical protein